LFQICLIHRVLISVIVNVTADLIWEVWELLKEKYLTKTILIFPPHPDDELERRWKAINDIVGLEKIDFD
jgi:hypothetical protein